MQRQNTVDEREAQLNAWDSKLEQRQRQLDEAVKKFRTEMSDEVAKLLKLQNDVAAQTKLLNEKAAMVSQREQRLLQMTSDFVEQQKSYLQNVEALQKKEVELAEKLKALPLSEEQIESSTPKDDSSNDEVQRTPPPPHLTSSSSKTVKLSPQAGTPNSTRSGGVMSMATSNNNVTPPKIPNLRLDKIAAQSSKSPALYEGPVDPSLPSHVEEISDGESTPTPRGLRSSPQFQPMDPNDSGLGFLRKDDAVEGAEEEAADDDPQEVEYPQYDIDDEEEENDDEALQAEFDEAVEFLVNSGRVSMEQIQAWLLEGVAPQQIIELYHKESAEAGADVDDDGEEALDDEEGELQYEEDYGDEEDIGEDDEEADDGVPLTADRTNEMAILGGGEDDEGATSSGDSPLHNGRIRGGGMSPNGSKKIAAVKHTFDDDSDEY